MEHISVLLNEAVEMLNVKNDGIYVDCTLGRGGHSSEILKRCRKGHLYCFDMDQDAIDESIPRLEKEGTNFTCIHAPFEKLGPVLDEYHVDQVDGILMDLGVSSPQFDDGQRGFSYREDSRLDMRMDQQSPLSAYEVINTYSLEELTEVFKTYGEEPFAYRIAKEIVKRRENAPIETTFQLVDAVKAALPNAVLKKKGHPAKRVFQAVRIEVNHELSQLQTVLIEGLKRLKPQGRMVVITFHSLEDRIVKNAFRSVAVAKKVDKRIPQLGVEKLEYHLLTRKPVTASDEELKNNPRARSAKLRGIERNENE
ncbi:16S rRNA (cytosine(1402)-N(4))-methyltransferase RsmH [uncultured Dubosiella sp.]|uniref:16S rRNA (cytosine(1402)-N(4))-methyltransferase RsmH n=1 Tax=uncultured Dubosiella sp. TaxID=1937011 RepID=UPI00207E9DAF|nr:16S rRNA (cytosine(1402)-N(4))-methyltransferase RsmH [uncultured Dubosiella sp.]GJM57259.1 ribosomal RNA small subunit methyltransferase H [Erysipelotrichaceae bacterium OPF54]